MFACRMGADSGKKTASILATLGKEHRVFPLEKLLLHKKVTKAVHQKQHLMVEQQNKRWM